jgi:hypothetical protein
VLASVALPFACFSVFVQREVRDDGRFVDTSAALAENPGVQDAVAQRVGDALVAQVQSDGVPPSPLLGPTPSDTVIRDAAREVVASGRFGAVWDATLRSLQPRAVALVRGDPSDAAPVDGDLVLDLDPVVAAVAARLPGPVAASLPPTTRGDDIVLVRSEPALVARAARAVDAASWWLPAACVVLVAGGIALAPDRRRALRWAGAGTAITSAVALGALGLGRARWVGSLTPGTGRAIGGPLVDAAVDPFRNLLWIAFGSAVALAGGATVLELIRRLPVVEDPAAEAAGGARREASDAATPPEGPRARDLPAGSPPVVPSERVSGRPHRPHG